TSLHHLRVVLPHRVLAAKPEEPGEPGQQRRGAQAKPLFLLVLCLAALRRFPGHQPTPCSRPANGRSGSISTAFPGQSNDAGQVWPGSHLCGALPFTADPGRRLMKKLGVHSLGSAYGHDVDPVDVFRRTLHARLDATYQRLDLSTAQAIVDVEP